MGNTSIVKLGGSVITDKKEGRAVLRTRRITEIAREIRSVLSKKQNMRLVLLYGVGSFAHPLAHRYRLLDRPLSRRTFSDAGETIAATRELGTRLCALLLEAGIPVVPLQTSSFARVRRGRLQFTDLSILETILKKGGVPLLGGDVVFSDTERTAIASADTLAVELSRKLKPARLYFASDTDGVYAAFPPRRGERPVARLTRAGVREVLKHGRVKAKRTDVTGAMPGKLAALLAARKTTAIIFNGDTKKVLADVLLGKKHGTQIVL